MSSLERLHRAHETARDHLLSQRLPAGHWEGRLASSALATATAVSALAMARHPADAGLVRAGVAWLARSQNTDGGWGDTPDSPSNLSTTMLCLSALTLARGCPEAPSALQKADAYVTGLAGAGAPERVQAIVSTYGADRTFAVPILTNCALAGLVPWRSVPGLPFELAAFPQRLYGMLRLQVVSYALPALIAVGLLLHQQSPSRNPAARLVRRLAAGAVRRKLRLLQPENGGFLEATPLTAFTCMSLTPVAGPCDPTVLNCLRFLRASMRQDGSWPIDTNLCVWLTTGAMNALAAGRSDNDARPADMSREELQALAGWIGACQYRRQHPYTGAAPGGWGWTDLPGGVPDVDDTSGALLALHAAGGDHGISQGVRWLLELQNSDGGWPTFCRGWGKLPFDQSCADVTAHALRALAATADQHPYPRAVEGAIGRGLAFLRAHQAADGSWSPLWFGNQAAPQRANPVLGTSRVLMALAQLAPADQCAVKALGYLAASQNADGGWGGDTGVHSSVEETALAVCALSNWPATQHAALMGGVDYLVERVESGSWTHACPIGLYFSSLWYSEELYPVIWTVEALGRARKGLLQLDRAGDEL